MLNLLQNEISKPEFFSQLTELESKIEEKLFIKNELSYLEHAKIQDLNNQITKIYLKYAPQEVQNRVAQLNRNIKEMIEYEDFSMKEYSMLDRELKSLLSEVRKPIMMTHFDEIRVERFQERIDEIYEKNEPSESELRSIDSLLQERETLLVSA